MGFAKNNNLCNVSGINQDETFLVRAFAFKNIHHDPSDSE